ncbi:Nramp family divalent metal transporter [Methanocorpusculum bavaricum]|jgi:Mn2+/Fe2+ NRAMP family transporter|uniref:Nramp family divalent metal transporter n=1 Tax=Methanocorpusculum bavaricum TaxID=71518 RepID=UPI0005B27F04|nr:Nramp family divalent metal transporter [Methanocorpusculum bavaricum]MDD2248631.1 Nramp family divalent metal transporter [Methanocorpusculum sp.]MDD4423435.1 Nramp family divalent metal transporter [Methanocorpusculum parvum]MDD2803110.1 Nramp family divalent metal transporter [Methanocorpusculum sp.]MDD3047691.1 Nramp family divalent metal transporter [Methanocorpusculum sp.]MDD3912297.1 Nramp family divalent metal transporter [Methanocorpusculum sp.]
MKEPLISRLRKWFQNNFVFFGPGLLLAITAAGEAGVTEAIEIGAHYGPALIWVVIITLIFKYAFTNGIARYTLATNQTIFDALNRLPGPKNWGSYLIIISYLMEMFAIGAMLVFSATFLDYLLPGIYSVFLIAVFLLVLTLAVIRTSSYEILEPVMAVLISILAGVILIALTQFPLSFNLILDGLVPSIPAGSEMAILAILGVVGSGLNLMLYSVWLSQKTKIHTEDKQECTLQNESFFRKYIRSVNFDVMTGFFFVAVVTIGFMFLGYAGYAVSFMPHGAKITLDTLITQILYIFSSIPYGPSVFLMFVAVIFFGAVVVGMDARARALAKVVRHLGEDKGKALPSEHNLYQITLLVFTGVVILAMVIADPMTVIRQIAAFSAILFGIFGFIVIYLDSRLPKYAKGSRLWMAVMGIGSGLSIYVALLIESSFLQNGIPLIERMLVIVVVLFVFTKTEMFKKLVSGAANFTDKLWTVALGGGLSIYGVFRGIDVNGLIFNFSAIGPIVAGLLGGPLIGGLAGLIGCVYRLAQGGPTAIGCSLAILAAGLIAGFAVRWWQGRVTIFKAVLVTVVIEWIHLLIIVPGCGIIFGTQTVEEIVAIVASTFLPITIVNTLGVALFAYFAKEHIVFAAGTESLLGRKKTRTENESKDPEKEEK